MSVIREWVAPASATALVAWIVIPSMSADSTNYDHHAVGQHRACALEGKFQPNADSYDPPAPLTPLVPSAGGKFKVIEAHECHGSMRFTHLILGGAGDERVSVLVTRSGEASERTFRRRIGNFDVTQVRTTRRRAFLVVDGTHARQLRQWRELTAEHMHEFLKQLEGR